MLVTPEFISDVTSMIPDSWLEWDGAPGTPDELRDVYRRFLTMRLENSETFLRQAIDARKSFI